MDYQSILNGLVEKRGAYGKRPNKGLIERVREFMPITTMEYDPYDDRMVFHEQQDVEPILKHNEALYNSGHDGYTPSRDMKHVASIPLVAVHKLYRMGIDIFNQNDWPKVAQLLDSPDFRKYRTSPGRISRRTPRTYSQAIEGWDKRRN